MRQLEELKEKRRQEKFEAERIKQEARNERMREMERVRRIKLYFEKSQAAKVFRGIR